MDTLAGYKIYDVNSFIDLYIINEFSKNIDGYRLSTYMYKDRDDNGGKLQWVILGLPLLIRDLLWGITSG